MGDHAPASWARARVDASSLARVRRHVRRRCCRRRCRSPPSTADSTPRGSPAPPRRGAARGSGSSSSSPASVAAVTVVAGEHRATRTPRRSSVETDAGTTPGRPAPPGEPVEVIRCRPGDVGAEGRHAADGLARGAHGRRGPGARGRRRPDPGAARGAGRVGAARLDPAVLSAGLAGARACRSTTTSAARRDVPGRRGRRGASTGPSGSAPVRTTPSPPRSPGRRATRSRD